METTKLKKLARLSGKATSKALDVLGMDEAQARGDMEQVWRPNGVWATFVGR